MREVILARHGESDLSIRRVVNGDPATRCPLAPAGRDQARRLGQLVARDRIDVCLTSRFQRASETADIALQGRDVPRAVMPDLDDIQVGRFEGGPIDDFRAWIESNGAAATPPGGGESRAETTLRWARAFRAIVGRPEQVALIICHGLAVTFAVASSRGEDLPMLLAHGDYAVPHRLSADEFAAGSDALERWAREQLAA